MSTVWVFQILLKSYSCSLIFPTSLFFFSPSLSFFCYILNVIIIIHYTMLFFIIQVFFPVFMTKRLLIRQKKRHEKEPDSSSYLSFRYFLFFSFLCLAFIKQLPVLAGYRKLLKYEWITCFTGIFIIANLVCNFKWAEYHNLIRKSPASRCLCGV